MPTHTWNLSEPDVIAEYLPERELRSLFEKRVMVPPDRFSVLIRDGQIIDTYRGAHFSVGGIWSRLKESIAGRHSFRLLIADAKPFQVTTDFLGIAKDHVEVAGEITFDFQLDPERPVNILGLMGNEGSLTRTDVMARVRPHLSDRVLSVAFAEVESSGIRTNADLQERVQLKVMQEVERVAGDLGLFVRAVALNFAANEEERQQIDARREQREEEARDRNLKRRIRELEREKESTVWEIRSEADLDQLRQASEHELEMLVARNQIEFADAREAADRLRERERLEHELATAKQKRMADHQAAVDRAQNDLERTRLDIERRELELDFEQVERRARLETESLERDQAQQFERRRKEDDLHIAGQAQVQKVDGLRSLQDLELDKLRAHHELSKDDFITRHAADMEKERLDQDKELEKLRLQAAMNPDQILAIQAGLSPDVAQVFAQRARTEADSAGGREALLREMVEMSKAAKDDSQAQAQRMFDRAVDRLAEAGRGAASPSNPPVEGATATDGSVECLSCHRQVPLSDRFCRFCGHQMRT
jgi:hypothetical protein